MTDDTFATSAQRRSLFKLLADLPGLISELIRAEIAAVTAELKRKAARAGVGVGLLAVAFFLLLLVLLVLVFAAVAGLAVVLPFWAAALIVAGGLLVLAVVFAAVGVALLKGSKPDEQTFDSIGRDLRSLRHRHPPAATDQGED